MSPCGDACRLATRDGVLVSAIAQVATQSVEVNRWRAVERRNRCLSADKAVAAQRRQLSDRDTASGDDKTLTLVKSAHYFATVVAQLALGDFGNHWTTVAHALQ